MAISFHYSTLNELTGENVWGIWAHLLLWLCKSDVFKSSVGVLLRFNFTPALDIC